MQRKSLLLVLLMLFMVTMVGCSPSEPPQDSKTDKADKITITDMAGRSVEIPVKINKVYSTGPVGTVFMYTLNPDKLAGWNSPLGEVDQKFIKPEYHNLPVLGVWRGSSTTGNIEELIKINPDIAISMGDVSEKYIADADAIQAQIGIPVIMVDGSLENLHLSYEFLGGLLGEEKKAQELGEYCKATFDNAKKVVAAIPEEKRKKIYYGQGPNGLDTEPIGSINAEVLDLAGTINVADPGNLEVRRMQTSIEQILVWEPDVVIISSDGDVKHGVYNYVKNDRSWKNIKAVKNGEVYEVPGSPNDWVNRPPSVARILGIKWLTNLVYPEYYPIDINAEVKEFYSKFYDYEFTPEGLDTLLEYARR